MALPAQYPLLIVDTSGVPREEQADAFICAGHAILADRFAYSISAAVGLADYCDDLATSSQNNAGMVGLLDEWRHIAARDAAINVYHLRKAVKHIRDINSPSLKAILNWDMIDQAWNFTRGSFPYAEEIRDAVGHTSDFVKNFDRFKHHAVNQAQLRIGSLDGRKYTVTKNRRDYSFSVDAALRQAAFRVSKMLCDAFMDAGVLRKPSDK